jgi:leader peptidase (prepilin peptidase)/N-methyltransferase
MIGSFLNVCIYRLPESRSIVSPPSSCPSCGKGIAFYDNIPVLSFIILRGKCRSCGAKISWRYPLVELMSGVLAALLIYKFGATVEFFFSYLFCASLIVVTFVDLKHWIILDEISLPGIVIFFVYSFFNPRLPWKASLLGIVLGGGFLALIAVIYYLLTKTEGMGMGDVKLLAMIGAFLGVEGVIFTLVVGSIVGSLVGLVMMLVSKGDTKMPVPFGPFLSLGAVADVFFGGMLFDLYFGLV